MSEQITSFSRPKRVLIMSVSAGNGHIKAAEALEKIFLADPRVESVVNKDALLYTNRLFRNFYSKLYASLARSAPNFLGWWYKASDEPWRTDRMRQMMDRLNTKPLVKFIKSYNPHITVCTHFMPAGIMSHLIATGRIDGHLSIVVTDYDFHAMWLSRAFQRYFVAIDETRAHLEMLGLPNDRITVSGIPIDTVFAEPFERAHERWALGLSPELPVLLLAASGLGKGTVAFIIERLVALRVPVQTIVACGRDETLRQRISAMVAGQARRFRVYAYTDQMHRLMKSADLYIGKPGGMSSSEAIACGLPFCIVSPIPGQEERNSDHLLEQGIAIKCNELGTLGYKIEQLLTDPSRLERMRASARSFAKGDAARIIVETLLEDDLPPVTLGRRTRTLPEKINPLKPVALLRMRKLRTLSGINQKG